MHRLRTRSFTVLLGSVAVVASGLSPSLAAQQDVSPDLVRALLSTRDRELELFTGSPPAGLARAVPFRAGDIPIGGLHGESTAVLVLQIRAEPSAAVAEYGGYLVSTGWEPGPDRRDPRGGFVNAPRTASGVWCSAGQSLQGTALGSGAQYYLRVRVSQRGGDPSVCDTNPMAQMARDRYGFRLPTLSPPGGAKVSGGGGSSSNDAMNMEVTVETELGPDEVFAHYRRQLEAAGWSPRGAATGEDTSIGRWDVLDEDGEPQLGILGVWASAVPGVHRAWIRVESDPRRR